MKFMNWALKKLNLVRKSEHDAKIKANHDFIVLIGNAAKEAGVNVILNRENIQHVVFDSDLFLIGSNNYIGDIDVIGSKLHAAPQSCFNMISCVRFRP